MIGLIFIILVQQGYILCIDKLRVKRIYSMTVPSTSRPRIGVIWNPSHLWWVRQLIGNTIDAMLYFFIKMKAIGYHDVTAWDCLHLDRANATLQFFNTGAWRNHCDGHGKGKLSEVDGGQRLHRPSQQHTSIHPYLHSFGSKTKRMGRASHISKHPLGALA